MNVACSRASSIQGLSILNFNEYKLISSSTKVENFYANSCCDDVHLSSLQCCTQKTLCLDGINGHNDEMHHFPDDFELDENGLQEIDNLCSSFFTDEENEQQNVMDLETVLNDIVSQMSKDISCSDDVSPHALLEQLKENVKNVSSTLSAQILDVIHLLQQEEYLPRVKLFASIQWNRLWKVLHEKSTKKRNDVSVKFDFKSLMSAEMLLCCSENTLKEFAAMMNVHEKDLKMEHTCVMTKLVKAVTSDVIGHLYNSKFEKSGIMAKEKNVWDMSKEGKGKVRYVGGWTIVKLIYFFKKYITTNSTSSNTRVRQEMRRRYMWINMLESLLLQSANIHESSAYKDTLTVTDVKQYRSNALVYVNDKAFEFFMELEQKRINTLCHENLNSLKGNMLYLGIDGVKRNCNLKCKWINLFDLVAEEEKQDEADVLYSKIVEKYFHMGAGQYIRDYRRDYNVTKTEAHRKRVQEKKITKERQNEKVRMSLSIL